MAKKKFEDLSGSLRARSEAEQNFVNKHVVQKFKHPVADDAQFTGKTKKDHSKKASYRKGEDEAVYEDTESLDEISDKLRGRYYRKAAKSTDKMNKGADVSYDKAGKAETRAAKADDRNDKKMTKKHDDDTNRHYANADALVKKLNKRDRFMDKTKFARNESVDLEEHSHDYHRNMTEFHTQRSESHTSCAGQYPPSSAKHKAYMKSATAHSEAKAAHHFAASVHSNPKHHKKQGNGTPEENSSYAHGLTGKAENKLKDVRKAFTIMNEAYIEESDIPAKPNARGNMPSGTKKTYSLGSDGKSIKSNYKTHGHGWQQPGATKNAAEKKLKKKDVAGYDKRRKHITKAMSKAFEEYEPLDEGFKNNVSPHDAHHFLKKIGARNKNYFALSSSQVSDIVDHGTKNKYRKGKHAPGSYGRMYHDALDRHADKSGIKEEILHEGMSDESHELHLHGDNDAHLYKSSHVPVAKNLEKKFKKGTYDHEKAKKLWKYHADRSAHSYAKQHGSPGQKGHHIFSVSHRKEAAKHWADAHHAEMKAGNFH